MEELQKNSRNHKCRVSIFFCGARVIFSGKEGILTTGHQLHTIQTESGNIAAWLNNAQCPKFKQQAAITSKRYERDASYY